MKLPQPGDILVQRYELLTPLGEGGFAVVYRAMDRSTGRDVAVKVLRSDDDDYSAGRVARFERELGALVRLKSPHTVQLLDHGRTEEGVLFLVFELVPGVDLSAFVVQGPMDPAAVRHILLQLLASLQEAHAAGILHRDIKPGNIRVFQNGADPYFVKLLDFGVAKPLAKHAPSVTRTGHMVGTLKYSSPEQLFGLDLTPSSDLYSLGLVAYELLTGTSPDHMRAYGAKEALRLPPGPFGPALRYAVERMLAHEESKRFTTAAQAAKALVDGPADGRSGRAVETLDERPERRLPVSAPIVAVSFVVGAALVGGGYLLAHRDEEPAAPAAGPTPVARTLLQTSQRTAEREPEPEPEPEPANDVVETPDVDTEEDAAPRPEGPLPRGCGKLPPFYGTGQMTARDQREFTVVVPDSYDMHKHYVALISFHEVAELSTDFVRYSGFANHANENNYIIIAPAGQFVDPWEGDFAKHMLSIDTALDALCVDPDRIFALGNGSGASPAERLACDMNIRAVANSGMRNTSVKDTRCLAKKSVPLIYFAHNKDLYEPLEGGGTCFGDPRISLKQKQDIWKRYNGCRGPATVYYKYKGSECTTWTCDEPFVSCVVNGGRRWPGTRPRMWDVRNCDGPVPNFEYVPTIWQFFKEQTPDADLSPRRLVDVMPVNPGSEAPPENPPE